MSIVFPRLGAFVVWIASLPVFATNVQLGTNVSDFEQFYNRGGGSVEHIQCIFDHLGYTPEVQRMPWRRARQEVSTGKIDGFFTAIHTPEVDKYATLSSPLLLENWYWYWPAGTKTPGEARRGGLRIGAILGSHQAVWLDQQLAAVAQAALERPHRCVYRRPGPHEGGGRGAGDRPEPVSGAVFTLYAAGRVLWR